MINRLTRGRGLRSNRRFLAIALASVAALGVYFYAQNLQRSADRPVPRTRVVVATTDLAARTIVRADSVQLRELPNEAVLARSVRAVDGVVGKMLTVPVAQGEQILADQIGDPNVNQARSLAEKIPPGHRALAVNFTEASGSGGLIIPGDHVDIIATFEGTVAGRDQSLIILQDVLVLAVAQSATPEELGASTGDQSVMAQGAAQVVPGARTARAPARPTAGPGTGTAPLPSNPRARTVTLAVRPEASQRLALAEDLGTLRYALRPAGERVLLNVPPTDMGTIRSALTPPSAEIIATEITPLNARVGDVLTVRMTVRNTSDRPLETQGPDSGFVYEQGQSYASLGYVGEAEKWRVALGSAGLDQIELPYRWGLGEGLQPGATTTIVGQVRLLVDFRAVNFWTAVVREPGTVIQNGMGMSVVSALPANTAIVNVDVANARSGPAVEATIVTQLGRGAQLQVIGQSGDWLQVRLPDQREAWVATSWVLTGGR